MQLHIFTWLTVVSFITSLSIWIALRMTNKRRDAKRRLDQAETEEEKRKAKQRIRVYDKKRLQLRIGMVVVVCIFFVCLFKLIQIIQQ